MQDHRYSFEVEGTPAELWRLFWNKRKGQVLEHGDVRIEILHAGDETGEGLIRINSSYRAAICGQSVSPALGASA